MNKLYLVSFVCILNFLSFEQINATDILIYNLDTLENFEEQNAHLRTKLAKKTDVERLGLKGPIRNIQMKSWVWEVGCGHNLFKTEVYKETVVFDIIGNRTACQKTFDRVEVLNFEY